MSIVKLIGKENSIFDSKCQALVNPVNCVGIMGKGLAKQFKEKFPHMHWQYVNHCREGLYFPGTVKLYAIYPEHYDYPNPMYVINFATKGHWSHKSKIDYIKKGLKTINSDVAFIHLKSIAFPMIGAGLGGLDSMTVYAEILLQLEGLVPDKKDKRIIEVYDNK